MRKLHWSQIGNGNKLHAWIKASIWTFCGLNLMDGILPGPGSKESKLKRCKKCMAAVKRWDER